MLRRIITLTTDFGSRDAYVAEMKAVILRIYPEATIVDISHEIEKYSVRTAAFILASASHFFPEGTVHVAVVDPGVGTERKAVAVLKGSRCFIGPDNGILALAVRKTPGRLSIHEITEKKYMLPNPSDTFHGRDIFAPAAAHVLRGIPLRNLGPKIDKMIIPSFSIVEKKDGLLVGEAVHVDGFGNIITNISEQELGQIAKGDRIIIRIGKNKVRTQLCGTYGEIAKGKTLALIGSHGFLEISRNQGNAAETYHINAREKVSISCTSINACDSRIQKCDG